MQKSYGQHGWREFHTNRQAILTEYDRLRELSVSRPVKTAHGNALEAAVRRWFAEFLPKKFGVTSGYVVPDLYDENLALYHFDIIVYDALSAPVLWTEGNADDSEQGKSRAIPAKHVIAIFEVKARLTSDNVRDALSKLDQTSGFATQLHPNFSCGVMFAELLEGENRGDAILSALLRGAEVFRFAGGAVLRYEEDTTSTGLIQFHRGSNADGTEAQETIDPMRGLPLAKAIDALAIYLREDGSLELGEIGAGAELVCVTQGRWEVSKSYGRTYSEGSIGVHLSWSRGNFSRFCIDFLSRLEGLARTDGQRPTFGRIFDKVEVRKAPGQELKPATGKPFLRALLHPGGSGGKALLMSVDGDKASVTFWVSIENRGSAAAEVSDDGFKTKIELQPGAKAVKQMSMVLGAADAAIGIKGALAAGPVEVAYRIVYRTMTGDKDLTAIDSKIVLDEENPQMKEVLE